VSDAFTLSDYLWAGGFLVVVSLVIASFILFVCWVIWR
jgi:hypothetical protein